MEATKLHASLHVTHSPSSQHATGYHADFSMVWLQIFELTCRHQS